jgi:hypothetical protein
MLSRLSLESSDASRVFFLFNSFSVANAIHIFL